MATEKKTFIRRGKALKEKLSLDIVKQPEEIKKRQTKIIIRTIIFNLIASAFAFALKGSQLSIQHGWTGLAIIFLLLYFAERAIASLYVTYAEFQEDTFKYFYTSVITEIIMEMNCKVRNKIFKKNEKGIENVMPHPEVLKKSKNYLESTWNFWWNLPVTISNIITLVLMIVITLKMELLSGSMKDTGIMLIMLVICIVIYLIFGKKRIEVMKQYRRTRKENESKEDVLMTEINGIEFSSNGDFMYHADRLRKQLLQSRNVLKIENLKLNSVFIKRSIVASVFMIFILVYKLFTGDEINEQVILGVISISTIYSTILNKISDILKDVENLVNFILDVDKLYPDFSNIYTVYCEEKEKEEKLNASKDSWDNVKIKVEGFTFSYDSRNSWSLINPNPFKLLLGEVVLVEGETGLGKTTTLNVLNGNVRMPASPIRLSNGQAGYLKTLTYHTDRSMANNYILNEIILSDDYQEVDENKLFEILEGLGLKSTFLTLAKNDDALSKFESEEELILEFMKIRTYRQFSSGQQQRIALAKLLYTLEDSVQAVWLDEAFNRLNGEVAKQCVKFILEYVQRERQRLILIATHQLNIVRPFCSKEISFEKNADDSSVIRFEQI